MSILPKVMRVLVWSLLGVCQIVAPALAGPPELRIYSWEDYVDQAVLDEFGRANGVTVRVHYFNSDTERDNHLVESDGKGYDIVTLNGTMIDVYRKRGWLAPLDVAAMPDLRHADGRWRDAYPGARTHAVPFMVGTLGIIYRSDRVSAGMDSWMSLLKPAPALCGHITMGGDSRELINMALKALGASAGSRDPEHYRAAEALLVAQRRCVADYRYPTVDSKAKFDRRDGIVAAMAFSSDAVQLIEADPRLRYVVPREGGGLWVDYNAVLGSSRNRKLAMALLNYMQKPAVHARLAQAAYSMPTNSAAKKLLPAAMKGDPTIFPDAQVLARSELDVASTPEITRIRNAIFGRIAR